MLVFSTQPCELLPLKPSHWFTSSTPPSIPKVKVQYIQTVCGPEGVGVLSCVGDHILQEFNTLFLTGFRNYKIALPSQNKNLGVAGSQTDKHLPQSPFTGEFLKITTLGIAFYQSNLSKGSRIWSCKR